MQGLSAPEKHPRSCQEKRPEGLADIYQGENLNDTGSDGNYPLGLAALDGQTDIVDELIKGGAEVNKTAGNGAAALH